MNSYKHGDRHNNKKRKSFGQDGEKKKTRQNFDQGKKNIVIYININKYVRRERIHPEQKSTVLQCVDL